MTDTALNANVIIAEVEIIGTWLSGGHLPPFRGATIRGGLGYHLRKTVCNNLKRKCADCFLVEDCAYSNFFEGILPKDRAFMALYDNVPQPFMLLFKQQEPTEIQAGTGFQFGMKLFGNSSNLFPYIAYSFLQMGEKGVGKEQIVFELDSIIQDNGLKLYEKGINKISKPKPKEIQPETIGIDSHEKVRVQFLTPVNIRKDGKTARELTFRILTEAALRRIVIINYFYGSGTVIGTELIQKYLHQSEQVETVKDTTQYYSFNRYSGRQQRMVRLEGLSGALTFQNITSDLLGILKLSEQIGLGKSTSFGFGRINIEVEKDGGMHG